MAAYTLSRKDYNALLKDIIKKYPFYAPVKKDVIRFEKVSSPDEINLEENFYVPLKGFFFKNRQVLFEFDKRNISNSVEKTGNKVFFGIRRCDLNAIKHQDRIFMEEYHDHYYIENRKNIILLGYHCNTAPSPYCFCGTLGLADFYDMMFFDKGDYFLVDVGSEKGRLFAKEFGKYFTKKGIISESDKNMLNSERLFKTEISSVYAHPDWKNGVELCLSCGACTTLCPVCYCFEMHDFVDYNLEKGERIRQWSSCQLQEFTRVAGNHIFRKEREHRFKHRIYHQLQYYKERYGTNMCTGCGRCIIWCPSKIDFVSILNGMK